jgi:hypothetical protein
MDREKVSHGANWANIGTFVLTVVILVVMLGPAKPQTTDPANRGWSMLSTWAMPSLLAASVLAAAILNFVAYRRRDMTVSNKKPEIVEELEIWKKNFAETSRQRDHFQQDYAITANRVIQLEKEVSARIKLPLTPLEVDGLYTSFDLLNYLKEMGSPPPLKYTAKDLKNMPSQKMKELFIAEDVDFSEACEYHNKGGAQTQPDLYKQVMERWKRKYPWFQKMEAGYALRFKDRVETLRHRFLLEGIADDGILNLSVENRDGPKIIETIAAKLWQLVFESVGKRMKSEANTTS